MKIIFLDIDNVLNSDIYLNNRPNNIEYELWDARDIDPKAIELINELVKKTNARIVMCSSWARVYSVDELNEILKSRGLNEDIFDVTPHYPGDKKEEDIYEWLDKNKYYYSFVILDDWKDEFKDLLPYIIAPTPETGLTKEHCEQAFCIIQKEYAPHLDKPL